MKKLAIWAGLILSCCTHPDTEVLTGSWKYDIPAMRAYLSSEQSARQTVNYMEGIMAPLRNARLKFKPGGELVLSLDGEVVEGRWRLRGSRSKLTLNLTGTNSVYRIEQLSDTLLLLRPMEQEEGVSVFPRVLVPAD
jgi:hypothetical protein